MIHTDIRVFPEREFHSLHGRHGQQQSQGQLKVYMDYLLSSTRLRSSSSTVLKRKRRREGGRERERRGGGGGEGVDTEEQV